MHVHEPVFGISAGSQDEDAGVAGLEDWLPAGDVIWLAVAMAVLAMVVSLV